MPGVAPGQVTPGDTFDFVGFPLILEASHGRVLFAQAHEPESVLFVTLAFREGIYHQLGDEQACVTAVEESYRRPGVLRVRLELEAEE